MKRRITIKERTIQYKGKYIDIYFTVDRCTHVAECIRGAPEVFDISRTPWIIADALNPNTVAKVILRCPTGALHFKRKDGKANETIPEKNTATICRNGPLYLHGDLEIRNDDGSFILKDTRLALCRCGQSSIKPLCDQSHEQAEFKDDKAFPKGTIQKDLDWGNLIITLKVDGPLQLQGPIEIQDKDGNVCFNGNQILLCRCGKSQNKPFCDGSHVKSNFKASQNIVLVNRKKN